MGAGRLNHHAPIHRHKVNSAEWTRLEFYLWLSSPTRCPLPNLPTKSGLPPLPLLPGHWFATKCSHVSPFHSQRFSYLQQIHTQAFEQRIALILNSLLTYSPPPFLHPQSLPFCNIQLTSSIQNLIISPLICTGHSHGSKTE